MALLSHKPVLDYVKHLNATKSKPIQLLDIQNEYATKATNELMSYYRGDSKTMPKPDSVSSGFKKIDAEIEKAKAEILAATLKEKVIATQTFYDAYMACEPELPPKPTLKNVTGKVVNTPEPATNWDFPTIGDSLYD